MKLRKLTGTIAAAVSLIGSVLVASPASATTFSGTFDCSVTPGSTLGVSPGDTVNFTGLSNCAKITIPTTQFTSAVATRSDSTTITPTTGGGSTTWEAIGGPYTITELTITLAGSVPPSVWISGSANIASQQLTRFTLTTTGGGSTSGGSQSNTPQAARETLALELGTSGATCTGGNPTGYSGAWLTLPSADQCTQTGPTAKANATLLGWSTAANFPVARAQAQIDAHWGVIDEDIVGIRMIFIPAGMATFVSGSNTLYPVWSA